MTKLDGSFQIDGHIDGDQLAAPTSTKRGGVKATGNPSGKFYKDDDTWADPAGTGSDITTASDADELPLLDNRTLGADSNSSGTINRECGQKYMTVHNPQVAGDRVEDTVYVHVVF
jgi:hypothetical protein